MNNRIDAIYARQSVDKKDSISIESQIEFCKYELKGGNCKEYTDKGYSGKNTDRPKFQELVRDIKRGLIAKVVVYKLDRISRSILDFANMMELFQQYDVEFVSSTEKFDTSTPMGRAMLNICIVFAQLERETIQKRVTDAYYSRSQRGFKMGGKAPYGFHTENGRYQHKEAGGEPGRSGQYPADIRDVRPAHNLLRGHYPVLRGTGDFVLRQRADTPHTGTDVTQSRLCAGGLGCVRIFQKPGYGHRQ